MSSYSAGRVDSASEGWQTGRPVLRPGQIFSLFLSGGLVVMNLPAMEETQEIQVQSLGWEDPLEEEMATFSSILSGKFHGQRSLAGYSLQGCRESGTTEKVSTHTHTPCWTAL